MVGQSDDDAGPGSGAGRGIAAILLTKGDAVFAKTAGGEATALGRLTIARTCALKASIAACSDTVLRHGGVGGAALGTEALEFDIATQNTKIQTTFAIVRDMALSKNIEHGLDNHSINLRGNLETISFVRFERHVIVLRNLSY